MQSQGIPGSTSRGTPGAAWASPPERYAAPTAELLAAASGAPLRAMTQPAAAGGEAPGVSNEAVLERLRRAAGSNSRMGRDVPSSQSSGGQRSSARRGDDMAPLLRAAQDSLRRAAAAAEADFAGQGRELAQDLSYDGRKWRELFEQRVLQNERRQQQGGAVPPARSAPASPARQRPSSGAQRQRSGQQPPQLDVMSGAIATLRQLTDRSPSPAPSRRSDGGSSSRSREQQRGRSSRDSSSRRGGSTSVPPPLSRGGPLGAVTSVLDNFREAASSTFRDLTPGRQRPSDAAPMDESQQAAPGAPPALGGFLSLSFTPGSRQPMHVLLGGGAMGGVGAHAAAAVPGPWQPGWTPRSMSGRSTPAAYDDFDAAGGLTPAEGSSPPDTPRSVSSTVASVASTGLRGLAHSAGHALTTGLGATLLRVAAGGISRVASRAGSAASTPGGGASPAGLVEAERRQAAMAANLAVMPNLRLSSTTATDTTTAAAASVRTSFSEAVGGVRGREAGDSGAAPTAPSRRSMLHASATVTSQQQRHAQQAEAAARARAEAAAAAETERLSRHAAELARRLEEMERSGAAAAQAAARKAAAAGVAWHEEEDDADDVALSQRLAAASAHANLTPEQQLRLQAVITIQAAFWAWQARKLDASRRNAAALIIQSWWRGHVARTAFEAIREPHVAAIIIQCCWRGYIVRRDTFAARASRAAAATRLQAAVRGYLSRKGLFLRLQVEDEAAVTIQAAWRGYKARVKVGELRLRVIPAVVCIQVAWMQYRAARLRFARDYISAAVIQAAWRGYAARQAYVQQRWIAHAAAVTIQTHWRRYIIRRELAVASARANAAALRIQAAWLSHLERSLRVQRNDCAATTIQRIWRGATTRATVSAQSDRVVAATLIAAAWRGYNARSQAAYLRHARDAAKIASPKKNAARAASEPTPLTLTARQATSVVDVKRAELAHARVRAETVAAAAAAAAAGTAGSGDTQKQPRVEVKSSGVERVPPLQIPQVRSSGDGPDATAPLSPTSLGRPPLPPPTSPGAGAATGSALRRSSSVAEAQRAFSAAVARSANAEVASSAGAHVKPAAAAAAPVSTHASVAAAPPRVGGGALDALSRIRAAAEATANAHAAQRTAHATLARAKK